MKRWKSEWRGKKVLFSHRCNTEQIFEAFPLFRHAKVNGLQQMQGMSRFHRRDGFAP